jgi:hypothetical protein
MFLIQVITIRGQGQFSKIMPRTNFKELCSNYFTCRFGAVEKLYSYLAISFPTLPPLPAKKTALSSFAFLHT